MGSADRVAAVLALLAGAVGLAGGIIELCKVALELRRAAGGGYGATVSVRRTPLRAITSAVLAMLR
jgi:hypothetical protein